ncbi:MFS general substrate transporter [Glonium stellatum]|uniref:MFS general substrate transporter n=1 Tax=Glonium stellatum TaxID=574774 RepID=A0A8E2FDP7_9PEZI|nr:MFS general substrate transporter [Glonium stellatum]
MTASPKDNHPTETSPLLPRPDHLVEVPPHPVDLSAGLVPEGADPYEDDQNNNEAEDGGDIERQVSNDQPRQHGGLPEVRKKLKYIIPAVAIGVFLAAADQTIIVSTYGTIGTELNALNKTSWIATSYFLTLTSFQPLYGKLSDIFGRKSCLLFAYSVFGLGCLFCGMAKSMNQLIAARAFAGIGGGGMTTVVSILLSDIVPLRERGKWQGYINIIYALGAGSGAPLGGVLADNVGWRWAFIAQGPLCLAAFIAVAAVLKLPKQAHSHWKDKLLKVDFLGAFILVCAVFGLLLGLDRGSNVAWSNRVTIVALATSCPLFILFVLVEMYIASNPFAPGHIIFDQSLFACYLCNFFSFGGWLAAIFFIPLYFQVVDGCSASQAGIRLLPGIVAGVSGSLFGGIYMQKTGKYYWITVIAYTNLVVGMIVISLFSGFIVNSLWGMIAGMMICGFSNGIGVTTTLIGLIANADHSDQAVVTACSYLFRSLGSVFGVSISATFANQALRTYLEDKLRDGKDAAKIAERVRQSLSYIKTLEPGVKEIVRDCYGKSTRTAFWVSVVFVAGSAFFAWFIREKRLSK